MPPNASVADAILLVLASTFTVNATKEQNTHMIRLRFELMTRRRLRLTGVDVGVRGDGANSGLVRVEVVPGARERDQDARHNIACAKHVE